MVMGLLKLKKLRHRAVKYLLRSDHKGILGRGAGGWAGEGLKGRKRMTSFDLSIPSTPPKSVHCTDG